MTSLPPMEERGPAITEADVRRFEQDLGYELPAQWSVAAWLHDKTFCLGDGS